MFARRIPKGVNHHAQQENKNVAEQNRQRMAHEEVFDPVTAGSILELFLGHDREGTNVGAAQPGIVRMVMVVRAAPDAARAQSKDSKNSHQPFRDPRFRQNGMMLLIVINHEKPQD